MAKMIFVTKSTGEKERFNSKKIYNTCIRAGAPEDVANRIVKEVEKKIYNGISTHAILEIVLKLLSKELPQVAARYDLKGAIMRLGPAGFVFESLFAEILDNYGYSTSVHSFIQGHCIKHEIDIIAAKPVHAYPDLHQPPLKWYMIECKYHNAPGIFTGSKEVMYTYARFLDLSEGWKEGKCQKFDQPWLASNTKFSMDAIQFSVCRNIKLTGWKYPAGNGLNDLIEEKKLYPITVLRNLDQNSMERLAKLKMVLVKDLYRYNFKKLQDKTNLSERKLKELLNEADKVISNGI